MPSEHDELLHANAGLHADLSDRGGEIAADERAATIFGSVEELYRAYNRPDTEVDVDIATLRQVNWGFRTVTALLDDETPPALFKIQEPIRWAYTKTLVVAGSFGLLVAVLLYELLTNG